MLESITAFLTDNAVLLGSGGAALGIGVIAVALFRGMLSPFKKPNKTDLSDETIEKIAPAKAKDGAALTVTEFIRIRRELKDELQAELDRADSADKEQMRARIAELERQIADPEPALKDARARIADLEARLTREANTLDSDKLNAARAALETGDYPAALRFGEQALELARAGDDQSTLGKALNNHAGLLEATGRFEEAEPLYRQALKITEVTLGTDHPDYATRLNNLAGLLRATGRFEEAEPLYRQALKITEVTLGTDHPDYATRLNNLAGLLEATGRFEEAEPLYRQALKISEATLGTDHPD